MALSSVPGLSKVRALLGLSLQKDKGKSSVALSPSCVASLLALPVFQMPNLISSHLA